MLFNKVKTLALAAGWLRNELDDDLTRMRNGVCLPQGALAQVTSFLRLAASSTQPWV